MGSPTQAGIDPVKFPYPSRHIHASNRTCDSACDNAC